MGSYVENLRRFDVKTVRITGAVVIALIVLAVILVNSGGESGSSSSTAPASEETAVLTSEELASTASGLGHPVYWLGTRPGIDQYEFSTNSGGETYVRYLPAGAAGSAPSGANGQSGAAAGGASRAQEVTVGTYEVPNAAQALKRAQASEPEPLPLASRDGYTILGGPSSRSAFVVFDNQPDLQIEVYSPTPGEAAELIAAGDLVAVE